MDQGGTTWIVTADSREARVFVERVRAGPLKELPELHMRADSSDHGRAHHQRSTVHASAGHGRSGAGERDLTALAEARFMRRVADHLADALARGEFDHLVLMAPPHALGALRLALAPAVAHRVEASDPHERRDAGLEELQHFLRDARARASA